VKESPKRVMVVDDDPDLLDLISTVLNLEGFQVITAADGQEALDAVGREMPNLILLDMKMPVMNGWEFANEFHSKYDHMVPIVAFTAAEDARKRAEEIGAEGYLGKPFDIGNLIAMVRSHANGNGKG